MLNWELIAHSQHQQELIEQAHHDQLAQEFLREQRAAHKNFNPAMAWLGERMLHLGSRLVELSGQREQDKNGNDLDAN
jgi:hypothetical protein